MKIQGVPLNFANQDEWRAWLEENHATAKEAWLIIYKKHTGKASLSYEEAVEDALCFGWIDGVLKPIDDEKADDNPPLPAAGLSFSGSDSVNQTESDSSSTAALMNFDGQIR